MTNFTKIINSLFIQLIIINNDNINNISTAYSARFKVWLDPPTSEWLILWFVIKYQLNVIR